MFDGTLPPGVHQRIPHHMEGHTAAIGIQTRHGDQNQCAFTGPNFPLQAATCLAGWESSQGLQ